MEAPDVALILVDLQVDFMPSGMLPVAEADQIIPLANELMTGYRTIVATQDWHPGDHGSFAANHPWRRPGQVIDLHGLSQTLWPIHCVQNTWGSEFVAGLDTDRITKIFQKGTDPTIDSYSGFYDNGHRKSTGMSEWLKAKGIREVHILGVAADFCVKFTVLDAIRDGFTTKLIRSATRGVEMEAGDVARAVTEMAAAGAEVI
jgi:nicotinamidase/pyrazinamidase